MIRCKVFKVLWCGCGSVASSASQRCPLRVNPKTFVRVGVQRVILEGPYTDIIHVINLTKQSTFTLTLVADNTAPAYFPDLYHWFVMGLDLLYPLRRQGLCPSTPPSRRTRSHTINPYCMKLPPRDTPIVPFIHTEGWFATSLKLSEAVRPMQ